MRRSRNLFRFAIVGVIAMTVWAPLPARDSTSDLKTRLQRELRERRMSAAYTTVKSLVEIGSASAMDTLVEVALSADLPELERGVASYLKDMPAGPALDRVCHHANHHSDYRVRVLLTTTLSQRPEYEAYKALLTSLYDRSDSVVFAALDSLQKKDDLGATPHLIRALQHQEEKGKQGSMLWYDIRRTLKSLTGRDLELARDWKNFWEGQGETFQRPPPQERDTEITSVTTDPPVFFGLEVVSKKVLFLLDISGSMSKKDPLPEEPGGPPGGPPGVPRGRTTVPDPGKKKVAEKKPDLDQDEIPESRMRLRRVQRELVAVIQKLPPDTNFGIVTFNHEIRFFQSSLVLANEANKRRAIIFVRDFSPEGETHTDRALQAAFATPGVNTIFLLSDGAPRRENKLLDTAPILEWVRDTNRFKRIRIHTVGFEQAGSNLRRFMKRLAYQNHGLYKGLR